MMMMMKPFSILCKHPAAISQRLNTSCTKISTVSKNASKSWSSCLLYKNGFISTSSVRTLLVDAAPDKSQFKTVIQARQEMKLLCGSPEYWTKDYTQRTKETALPEDLPLKQMKDSYREAHIRLKDDPSLRDKYVNFYENIRIGRIMEDLDTMAVLIGYAHNHDLSKSEQTHMSIVTALVDRIDLVSEHIVKKGIPVNCDIRLRGHVTWVGRTSMEIAMEVDQERTEGWCPLIDAKFLMVARCPHRGCGIPVPQLSLETPDEQKLFEEGKASHEIRLKKQHEWIRPPQEDEIQIIHNNFIETVDKRAATFKRPVKPEGSIWMEDSKLKNITICFPQERNLYGKIFGGYLMRQALELAWTNIIVYCKQRPYLLAVDDILFKKSVEIGNLLYLSSQVAYTDSNNLQVRVHAEVVNKDTGQHETTNVFHLTFTVDNPVPRVMPKSYSEYMMYLDGKRHFEESMKNRNS